MRCNQKWRWLITVLAAVQGASIPSWTRPHAAHTRYSAAPRSPTRHQAAPRSTHSLQRTGTDRKGVQHTLAAAH